MTPLRIPAIDGLRAIAALSVVAVHCWLFSNAPLSPHPLFFFLPAAYLGVDMFFVLSGFLLFLPYAQTGKPQGLRDYLRRRVARLVPAYYVSIVVVLVVLPFIAHVQPGLPHPLSTLSGVGAVIAHLTLLHQLLLGIWSLRWLGLGANPVWWTQTIEALFYATLPIVALRFVRRPGTWTAGLVVFSLAWRYAMFHAHIWGDGLPRQLRYALSYFGDAFPGYFGHFAIGMLAAFAVTRWHAIGGRRVTVVFAVGVTVAGAAQLAMGHDYVRGGVIDFRSTGAVYAFGRTAFALGFGAVLVGVARAPLAQRVLGAGPLKWIGDRSYGVYLFHYPIALAFVKHSSLFSAHPGATKTFVVSFIAVAALSVLVGALSWACIERPAIAWARRRENRVVQPTSA